MPSRHRAAQELRRRARDDDLAAVNRPPRGGRRGSPPARSSRRRARRSLRCAAPCARELRRRRSHRYRQERALRVDCGGDAVGRAPKSGTKRVADGLENVASWASIASRISSSCLRNASGIAARRSSQCCVLPSMSVKSNVTVPVGYEVVLALGWVVVAEHLELGHVLGTGSKIKPDGPRPACAYQPRCWLITMEPCLAEHSSHGGPT